MWWKLEKIVIPLVVLGLIGYMSYRPKFRLRVDMPPAFVDASSALSAAKRVPEEQIARAYWDCAVTEIQWKYSRTYLPPTLPLNLLSQAKTRSQSLQIPAPKPATGTNSRKCGISRNLDRKLRMGLRVAKRSAGSLRVRFSNYLDKL